jgi:subtilisin family serine protease
MNRLVNTVLNAMRTLRCALLVGLVTLGALAGAKGGDAATADPAVPGEILVRLINTATLSPLLVKHQLSLAGQFGSRPIYRLKVVGNADVNQKIAALVSEPGVIGAEPNALHRSPEARRMSGWAVGTPGEFVAQWAPTALRLADAHAMSSGAGVRVAVLDTGVDRTHPLLSGRLLQGFDFVDFDTDPSEVGNAVVNASYGHGTHVAGIIAMAAPGATILPVRVLDADGVGNAWVLAEALLYALDPDGNPATDDGAKVINLSLGSTRRTQLLDGIARLTACAIPGEVVEPSDDYSDPGYNADKARCAVQGGAVIVAAAGNDGSDDIRQYPAAEGAYGLLSVGASTKTSRLATFSNFGSKVDILAPGEGITSSVPGGGWGTWSGTSMAAPMAAGAAAMLRARDPGLSARDVTERLIRASAAQCGTSLRRIDPVAAMGGAAPPTTVCR